MADTTQKPADSSRRNFIKIGAGVVAGAVVAGGATAVYYNGVVGSKDSSITSLQSQLATATSNVTSLQGQLATATSNITSLQGQLSTATSNSSSLQSQLATAQSNATSLQTQLTTAQANAQTLTTQLASETTNYNSAQTQITTLNSQLTTANQATTAAQAQTTAVQTQLDTTSGFLTLNTVEQVQLAAICATIIPTDSTGPGATEAGVVYFIDRQLKGMYGTNGNVFTDSPFIPANTAGPITVDGITYTGSTLNVNVAGTPITVNYPATVNVRTGAGTRYQYTWNLREFWRIGLAGIEAYSNAAYGGNYETLSATNQAAVLTDLWNNKPTAAQFGDILPSDFAYEVFFMTWSGFGMDPVYGGNKNMVGWTYTGFNGTNHGNFYGEGYTTTQIMVMTSPLTLKPASLGQFQKGSP